ncbi:hypothetical protein Tco_0982188 [Tanacetum coccineum]
MKGKSVTGMNYYACLSILSLLILTPFAIAVEGPQVWAVGWQKAITEIGPQFIWLIYGSRLIVAIHGPNEDSSSFFSHMKSKSTWYRIVGSINSMHEKGLIPLSSMQRRVNNGASTKFWHDSWTGNSSFKIQFPRLFHLSLNKDYTVNECWNNGWHLEWSRNIINGTNAAQLAILQNTISDISLNDSEDV